MGLRREEGVKKGRWMFMSSWMMSWGGVLLFLWRGGWGCLLIWRLVGEGIRIWGGGMWLRWRGRWMRFWRGCFWGRGRWCRSWGRWLGYRLRLGWRRWGGGGRGRGGGRSRVGIRLRFCRDIGDFFLYIDLFVINFFCFIMWLIE